MRNTKSWFIIALLIVVIVFASCTPPNNNDVTATTTRIPTTEEKKEESKPLDYNSYWRNPTNYPDEYISFSGKVMDVYEDGNSVLIEMLLNEPDESLEVVVVYYYRTTGDRVFSGDRINVWAEPFGLAEYTNTETGKQILWPRFNAFEIEITN